MEKKFIFWQVLFLSSIFALFYYGQTSFAIAVCVLEAIILYGRFRAKEQDQYVLPSGVARTMKTTPLQLQQEMAILSTFLLILGIAAFTIVFMLSSASSWWIKGFTLFNSLAGIMFMIVQLVTSYQSYVNTMETQRMLSSMTSEKIDVYKVIDDYEKSQGVDTMAGLPIEQLPEMPTTTTSEKKKRPRVINIKRRTK